MKEVYRVKSYKIMLLGPRKIIILDLSINEYSLIYKEYYVISIQYWYMYDL